ncbi:MAG TPA: hypothetical protein VFV33_20820, partial [Gemmatimonadaceae bacterium]|nr:hypothetical protein [Gemmatimonadaceae bacterium]
MGRKIHGIVVALCLAGAAGAGAMWQPRGVPVGDIEVWGTMHPESRTVSGALRVHVKTPIGRIPMTGRARARYRCDATYGGTLEYSTLVRIFAALKGVDLVSEADGVVRLLKEWNCLAPPAAYRGAVQIQDTVLTGFLLLGEDSIRL